MLLHQESTSGQSQHRVSLPQNVGKTVKVLIEICVTLLKDEGEGLKEIAEVDENQLQDETPRDDIGEEKKDKEKDGEEEQTEKETARAGEDEKGMIFKICPNMTEK